LRISVPVPFFIRGEGVQQSTIMADLSTITKTILTQYGIADPDPRSGVFLPPDPG
jgi:hypothetical protein